MKIRYKFGVWMLCLMFPALVWAENAKSICTSFTQQGRQVTFHLADSAALQLQLCSPSVVRIGSRRTGSCNGETLPLP